MEFDKGTNPQLKNEINKLINLFLDEFMLEEYKGGQHILAREHYYQVFNKLLPKFLQSSASILLEPPVQSGTEEVLR